MKVKIKITNESEVVYEGKLIELPLKDEFIINRSIELFDDDDPCIIHKSYVIKDYVDQILDTFKAKNTTVLEINKHVELFESVSLDLGNCKIELLG